MASLENGFSRRGFIDLVGGAAAITLVPPAIAGAEPANGAPALRGLAAWLHTGPDGNLRGVFAAATGEGSPQWHSGGAPITLTLGKPGSGDPMWFWHARQQAFATTRSTLLAMAADGWGVAVDQCRCDGGRIVHPASGRAVGYRIWVTIA